MERMPWLLLGYQVPVEPSKKRVYVWRKLKEMGATYFRQGVAMLPKSPGNQTRFQTLALKIEEMGGDATLGELRYLEKKDELKAVAEFRLQSQREYQKAIAEIHQLYKEMGADPQSGDWGEEKARRLGRKLTQIKSRDYFMSHQEPEVTSNFNSLLRDMSTATTQLKEHIIGILGA